MIPLPPASGLATSARFRLGLGKAEHVSAICGGGVVSKPQGLYTVFTVADVASQQPASHRVALPALVAEVRPAFDQRLPMRLPAAFEPGAGALALQSRVLDGTDHCRSSTDRDQTSTKDRSVRASLPPVAAVTNLLKNRGFTRRRRLQPST